MGNDPKSKLIGPSEFALASFALAFVWVALGYWVASNYNDPIWAARFGCLGVIYGLVILVGFRWRFGQLRSGQLKWDDAVQEAIKVSSSTTIDLRVNAMAAVFNRYGEYERSKWVFLAEVTIIGVGTLQWGFGDWVALNLFEIGKP